PGSQGCLGSSIDSQHAAIAWARLRNPIVTYADSAAKDQGLRWANGQWHLLFSSIVAPEHWRIAAATSVDLTGWTTPPIAWPDQAGTTGLGAPRITPPAWRPH